LGLYLSTKLPGVGFPELITNEFEKDGALEVLASGILKTLFERAEHVPASRREIFRYNWQIRKDWSSRARYLRYALNPTDRDVEAMTLPRTLWFGYYVKRPYVCYSKDTTTSAASDPLLRTRIRQPQYKLT